jgi:leader peptidase (prepilin peptidase)/N-methyltransferase
VAVDAVNGSPERDEPEAPRLSRRQLRVLVVAASAAAVALAGAAFARFGLTANGAAWAGAEALLVFLAAFDIATRRVPNRVTAPAAIFVILLRVAFVHSALLETFVVGAAAFAVFLLLAVFSRGGLGMGDVKLAGLLGLLLGTAAVPALFLGVIAGGVASAAVLLTHHGQRGRTIAYAPYLCFGGAIAILTFAVPPLV